MSYKDQRGGGDGLDTIPGFSVKQKGQPHDTFSPTFKDGHVLTFRPFPEVLKDGTEAEWRTGPNEFEFGNQMCAVKMVRYWGANDKFTFICTLPDSEGGQEAASPAEMFYRAIKRAVDQKDPLYPMHWYEWFAGGQNQGEALSAPKIHLMLQGAVLQDGPKQYVDPSTGQASPKMPAILMLPVSARMEIERKMNEEVKGYQGSFEDYANKFSMGDVFSCAGGHAISIYKAPPAPNVRPHYEVVPTPTVMPIPVNLVAQHWRPWDELLHHMPAAEQVRLIERAFSPEAVDYAFSTTPHAKLVSDGVKGTWAAYKATRQQSQQPQGGGYAAPQPYSPPMSPQQAAPMQPVAAPQAPPATFTPPQAPTAPPVAPAVPQTASGAPGTFGQPLQAPALGAMPPVDWGQGAPQESTEAPAAPAAPPAAPSAAAQAQDFTANPVGDPAQGDAMMSDAMSELGKAQAMAGASPPEATPPEAPTQPTPF